MLTPHRRDSLIEWMKNMLHHSFVLDLLDETAPHTFEHFENLIEEHRLVDSAASGGRTSKLRQLVPTVGEFHTNLPLKRAFLFYDSKYRVTARRHVTISFNEIRQILNLSQVMALCGDGKGVDDGVGSATNSECGSADENLQIQTDGAGKKTFVGPGLVTFDGDQTLYSDGGNFDSNPKLARALALLLKNNVSIAVVTAAGYEYEAQKYALRLSGLLNYFKEKGLSEEECSRFYVMGGECNFLLRLNKDCELEAVTETGPGGWITATKHLKDSPGNWSEESVTKLLDVAYESLTDSLRDMKVKGRVIRKKRAVGLIPIDKAVIPREVLDEFVLRVQSALYEKSSELSELPYCAFNGGSDVWVDVGNKRVGVEILQTYLGLPPEKTLHIGDQFLNTGNDYAARGCSPCAWITSPVETTYILKRLLIFAGGIDIETQGVNGMAALTPVLTKRRKSLDTVSDLKGMHKRNSLDESDPTVVDGIMDVYTGEIVPKKRKNRT